MNHLPHVPEHDHADSPAGAVTDEERVNRLVLRLAQLGGQIEQRTRFGAVVAARTRARIAPNLAMVVAGLALFGATMEPLFAAAAVLSAFGWHRKLLAAAEVRRLWVRVDERGQLRESELGTA